MSQCEVLPLYFRFKRACPICRDGECEREYRVARKLICRQGELGYEPGIGGWGVMRTRAEALRDRWETVVVAEDEQRQLETVKELGAQYTLYCEYCAMLMRITLVF